MRILIGGSGSTGSSLLKNILSRHSAIFSGSETSLFCKRELFVDWQKHKFRITKRFPQGLKNYGYHMYNGIDLLHGEYGFQTKEIEQIIEQSNHFQEFSDSFFSRGIEKWSKKYWLEKTPANIYNFEFFLDQFSESKVIHIIRNPYDTILSLMSRGFNLLYASGIYLCNVSSAVAIRKNPNYIEVKYEDLIEKPEATVIKICKILGISFEESMMVGGNKQNLKETKIPGWRYDETDAIKKSGYKKFLDSSIEFRSEILSAIHSVSLNVYGQEMYNSDISSISDLIEIFNYQELKKEYENLTFDTKRIKYLRRLLWYDRIHRTLRLYNINKKYPIEING